MEEGCADERADFRAAIYIIRCGREEGCADERADFRAPIYIIRCGREEGCADERATFVSDVPHEIRRPVRTAFRALRSGRPPCADFRAPIYIIRCGGEEG